MWGIELETGPLLKSGGTSLFAAFIFLSLIGSTAFAQRQVTYYLTDPQGTPLATTDASGSLTATSDHRAYGTQVLGEPTNGPSYTGHVADADTALTYMQQRYYDPSIGRFLSVDPITPFGGDSRHFNRYGYAYDNPYRFTDADGRCPICVLVVAGVSLLTMSDYANAPGIEDKPISMSPAERLETVASALPASRAISTVRSVVRTTERLSQRAATREAKRQTGIPTSQQASSQTNGTIDGTKVGRQQSFEVSKEGGGTETKSVQVSRDVRGDHAGMPQIEAGKINTDRDLDRAGRPRITNDSKTRVDFDPDL